MKYQYNRQQRGFLRIYILWLGSLDTGVIELDIIFQKVEFVKGIEDLCYCGILEYKIKFKFFLVFVIFL